MVYTGKYQRCEGGFVKALILHAYYIKIYSEGILLDMMDVCTGVLILDLFTRPSDGVLGRCFWALILSPVQGNRGPLLS